MSPNTEINSDSSDGMHSKVTFPTPSQDKVRIQIDQLKSQIVKLEGAADVGFASEDVNKKIKKLRSDLKTAENFLNKKINDAIRKKKSRFTQKRKLTEICTKYPDLNKKLKFRDNVSGRPRIETDQPEILQALINIAAFGGATDDRRRSECNFFKYTFFLSKKLHIVFCK